MSGGLKIYAPEPRGRYSKFEGFQPTRNTYDLSRNPIREGELIAKEIGKVLNTRESKSKIETELKKQGSKLKLERLVSDLKTVRGKVNAKESRRKSAAATFREAMRLGMTHHSMDVPSFKLTHSITEMEDDSKVPPGKYELKTESETRKPARKPTARVSKIPKADKSTKTIESFYKVEKGIPATPPKEPHPATRSRTPRKISFKSTAEGSGFGLKALLAKLKRRDR